MKHLFIFLLICFSFNNVHADSIPSVSFITGDALGNIYIIRDAEIIKLNPQGKTISSFSKRDLGTPYSIDARDPFRVLVFYREFAAIRVLDNHLAEQSTIELRQLGINDPAVITGATDQGIWIYDQTSAQLLKIDPLLQQTTGSVSMEQYLGRRIEPLRLEQSQTRLAMLTAEEIILLDQFGTYIRSIPYANVSLMQLNEQELLAGNDSAITQYSLRGIASRDLPETLPSGISQAYFHEGKWWYIRNGWLLIPSM